MSSLDSSNGMAAKYKSDESDEIDKLASGVSKITLPVTVLSWNIYGGTKKGMTVIRNRVLRDAISEIKPDVMLLQETKTKIDRYFTDMEISTQDYNYREAQKSDEARVIYKTSAFEEVKESTLDERFLDTILEKVFPNSETITTRSGQVPGRQTIKDRICVVHLRHKHSGGKIIFVSYHNINMGEQSKIMASKICKIIEELHDSKGCCVIAGVDLNIDEEGWKTEDVKVPDYKAAPRREKKKKVDFFIVSKSTVKWKMEPVKSFDLFAKDTNAPFDEKVLDHDPLVVSLTAVKAEVEEKDSDDGNDRNDSSSQSCHRVQHHHHHQEEEEGGGDEREMEKEKANKKKLVT